MPPSGEPLIKFSSYCHLLLSTLNYKGESKQLHLHLHLYHNTIFFSSDQNLWLISSPTASNFMMECQLSPQVLYIYIYIKIFKISPPNPLYVSFFLMFSLFVLLNVLLHYKKLRCSIWLGKTKKLK